jgi:hypothetical protein
MIWSHRVCTLRQSSALSRRHSQAAFISSPVESSQDKPVQTAALYENSYGLAILSYTVRMSICGMPNA